MASTIELIIYFEDPSVHIQVVGNQLCKLKHKLLLIVNINGTDRCRHIRQCEHFLRT